MNSDVLKRLINDNKASLILKVQTGFYARTFNINEVDGICKIGLETEKIESNDTLKFTAFILACDQLEYVANNEIIDIYGKDYKILLRKNDILAISNTESLSYNSGNNDFIRFKVSPDQTGKCYSIRYEANYISVLVGPEFNVAYGIVKNSRRVVCSIFDSHLVFEVFVYTLLDLVQQFDEYSDTEWFKLFEQIFDQTGEYESFEDFIKEARDVDYIDMSIIYKIAHSMTSFQIENSLISYSNQEGE